MTVGLPPIPRLRPAALLGALVLPAALSGQSLRGSSASLDIQNDVAREHEFTYLKSAGEVTRFVSSGFLVEIVPTADFVLHEVSFPYARPEVQVFIDRLAGQYREACGEKLVVTSLTRPTSRQPRNASDRSVHPVGMAVDLRLSRKRECRTWLEDVLVRLERTGVVEATRERYPPHYHVAVFPRQYASYVAKLEGGTRLASTTPGGREPQPRSAAGEAARAGAPAPVATAAVAPTGPTALPARAAGATPTTAGMVVTTAGSPRVSGGAAPTTGGPGAATPAAATPAAAVPTAAVPTATASEAAARVSGPSPASAPPAAATRAAVPTTTPASATPPVLRYEVRSGETLWSIARRYGTTVTRLRWENRLPTSEIYAGQVIQVPATR